MSRDQAKPKRMDPRGFEIFDPPYGVWQDDILWNSKSVGTLTNTYDPEVTTVQDIVSKSMEKFASRNAIGERALIKREFVEDPKDKKKYEKLTLGQYSWKTYGEWGKRIRNFGSGLVALTQLQPKERMLIYAETQADWMTSALAAFNHNLTVVTAYATLGADAAAYAVNHTKSRVVVADSKLLNVLLKVHDQCPGLKYVIAMTSVEEEQKKKLEEAGVTVLVFDDVVAEGEKNEQPIVKPDPADLAVIMFTSGTTGNPKGVMLPHASLVCVMTGVADFFGTAFHEDDVYVAYLPLAHIMEITSELAMIRVGAALGYGNPHTLTNTGVKLAQGTVGDMVELRPTVVVFAPLVLEKIYNGVQARIENSSSFKKWLFSVALDSGFSNFSKGVIGAGAFWNTVIFKRMQAMIGGRIRGIVTGSAPLDSNVQRFVQTCFNCPVRQGYGATETCAASCIQFLCDSRPGVVGPPSTSCCIKLVDWEEGGYRMVDKLNPEIGVPRGEIIIGGELISSGYLVDPENPDPELEEKNRTDFVTDDKGMRWFHTGDIGQVDELGTLKIIDRKKDLVKLQQGEYVALSKVEGVLKLSAYVDNAMVHASSDQKFCTMLVCPSMPQVHKFCTEHNIDDSDQDAVCENEQLMACILKSCQDAAKGKLAGFETPKKVFIVPPSQTWTPENDLLTAAMKLKRKPIINFHKAEIDKMY